MQTRQIIDRIKTQRRYTEEGFLIIPARIARTGIQDYRAFELGLNDGDPMRVVRIYRPEDEVFNSDAMASFENKPVTNNHPDEFVDAKNWKELSVGFARNVKRDGKYLAADLIITAQDAIDMVVGGKVELSNGYTADYDWTPGTTPDGEAYDAVQRNIRGNHVAIVDAARCGPACRVSDSTNQGVKPMAVKKMTIDGIPFELEEAAAAAVEKLVGARDSALAQAQTANDALAAAETKHTEAIAAKDAEIESLKKDVMTPDQRDAMVEAWAKLTADAKRLVPEYDHKGKTCDAIRREVLGKLDEKFKPVADAVLGGKSLETADGETIKMAFNAVAALPATSQRSNDSDPVADAFRKQMDGSNEPEASGRDAYIQRMTDAWKPQSNDKE